MSLMIVLGLLGLLGYVFYRGLRHVAESAWDQVPPEHRGRSFQVFKEFPQLLLAFVIGLAFCIALGASLIHYLAFPEFAAGIRAATSWGPGAVGWIVVMWLLNFWSSPHVPDAAPPRGRSVQRKASASSTAPKPQASKKKPLPTTDSPLQRGRVIRTIREIRR